jgi:hypothetical protein
MCIDEPTGSAVHRPPSPPQDPRPRPESITTVSLAAQRRLAEAGGRFGLGRAPVKALRGRSLGCSRRFAPYAPRDL